MENKQTLEELADYVMTLRQDVAARRRMAYLNEDTMEYAEAVGAYDALRLVYDKIKTINDDTTTGPQGTRDLSYGWSPSPLSPAPEVQ